MLPFENIWNVNIILVNPLDPTWHKSLELLKYENNCIRQIKTNSKKESSESVVQFVAIRQIIEIKEFKTVLSNYI